MPRGTNCWEKRLKFNDKDKVKSRPVAGKTKKRRKWSVWTNSTNSLASSGTKIRWSEKEQRKGQNNQKCRAMPHSHLTPKRSSTNQRVRNLSRKIRTSETQERKNHIINMKSLKKETVWLTSPLRNSFRMPCLIQISTRNHQQSRLKSMTPSLQWLRLGALESKKNQRKILRGRKLMILVNRWNGIVRSS